MFIFDLRFVKNLKIKISETLSHKLTWSHIQNMKN